MKENVRYPVIGIGFGLCMIAVGLVGKAVTSTPFGEGPEMAYIVLGGIITVMGLVSIICDLVSPKPE